MMPGAGQPHPRQIDCAAFMRKLVAGSEFLRTDDRTTQDAHTLRCVPQVHGAGCDAIAYSQWVINIGRTRPTTTAYLRGGRIGRNCG